MKKILIIIMFLLVFACRDHFNARCDDLDLWTATQCCWFCHPDGKFEWTHPSDFIHPPATGGMCVCRKTGKNTMLTLPPSEENKSREK